MKDLRQRNGSADPVQLARRAAMLRESVDALPPGRDRDALLLQLQALEQQLRSAAAMLDAAE
jgi:hypothetical protein